MFWGLESSFLILKRMASYSFWSPHYSRVVTLHNHIRGEIQRDWLFEKYSNDERIVIDNDDEDEEDERLTGLMPSHLAINMESFLTVSLV